MTKQLSLTDIRIDGGTQMRQQIDNFAVDDYALAFTAGEDFPAVKVFHDGKDNWLADGFHRWHAAKQAGLDKIKCDVEQGSLRDAILYAVGANRSNGMRRTNGDKRVCVMKLLHDTEWCKRSDRWIGEKCGVDHTTVAGYRSQAGKVVESTTCENGGSRKVAGKDGKTYTVKRSPQKRVDLHVPPIDEEIGTHRRNAIETNKQTRTTDPEEAQRKWRESQVAELRQMVRELIEHRDSLSGYGEIIGDVDAVWKHLDKASMLVAEAIEESYAA